MTSTMYLGKDLKPIVVPFCKKYNITYQQDGASAHTAKKIQGVLKKENINIIDAKEGPPNSPDLNPLVYSIWGTLEKDIYKGGVLSKIGSY